MMNKARKESIRVKKLKAQKIIKQATRSGAKPYSLDKIISLQVDGRLNLETFYEHISGIFPFILERVNEGIGIRPIEKLIGFNHRSLEEMLMRYPRLGEEVKKARRLRSDDMALSKMVE